MAKDAVEKFVESINKSPELLKKCKDAVEGSKDAGAFAALGKANGFEFSAAEAAEYFQETLGATKPPALTELGEEDLAKAAGGKDKHTGGRLALSSPELLKLNQSVCLFRGIGHAPAWTFYR